MQDWRIWFGYAIAVLGVIAGLALYLLLELAFGERSVYLFLIPAIVAASALGGFRPGLLATLLSLIAVVETTFPADQPVVMGDVASVAVFAGISSAIMGVGSWLQRTRQQLIVINRSLRESEMHLQTLLQTIPVAMIVTDERGLIRSFSHAAEDLFGWAAGEVLGRNANLLMPARDRETHDGYLDQYERSDDRRTTGTDRIVMGERKNGSTFPMELTISEALTDKGRFFTGFVRDLTERHRSEARLQELQSELVRVSRVTAMGEMASAIAHELNQPLSAIANYLKGAAHLLSEPDIPRERLAGALEKAGAQALRAGHIIRRLREFLARGETERRIESLSQLIDDVGELALVGAKERGITVRRNYDPSTDLVLADRVQIQQVVTNLLRNSFDAMEGSLNKELTISVERVGPELAQVSVADTGPGIDSEVIDTLFQPFVTTKANGMGVGLSISRTIVESHGGRIWAEATPGGGATFRFTLRSVEREEDGRD
ncbi:PAS domain-containing sensor histidine kinase [Aliidongia dinghuensis]|uniref:Sensor protein FixL n=1 Tax=Aliidongia dinghuensis TaxID=1867774 RepID=A0A8J3E2C7_9PROT|nr:PAS domain-containing sensor histidine kinase [Aliidongia dinghuensis]